MHSLSTVVSDLFHKKSIKRMMVALLAEEHDRAVLLDLSRRNLWDVSFAGTCQEAFALISQAKAQILLMDRDLAGSDWKESMSGFASSSDKLCIVLVSKVVDPSLWNEVVRNGGYEVLP